MEKQQEFDGIKTGHGKVPKFLVFVYIALLIWAVGYGVLAKGYQGAEMNPKGADNQPAAQVSAGETLYQAKCSGCHGNDTATLKAKGGSQEQLISFLADPQSIPAMQGVKLSGEEAQEIADYLWK